MGDTRKVMADNRSSAIGGDMGTKTVGGWVRSVNHQWQYWIEATAGLGGWMMGGGGGSSVEGGGKMSMNGQQDVGRT